mmetsp:Transcript_28493/g.82425  ORF Transcript_28493/g.82425 Transcript_28493/m.82425 type:complete len:484 (+) Transcript_28493:215-1666(+)
MSATITTACNAGEDPLSFLLGGSPAVNVTTSHSVDDRCSNRAALLSSPAQNDSPAAPATDRATVTERPPPSETPQERAARLLAMCDERGVGTAKDKLGPASTLEGTTGTCVDETIEKSSGTGDNPRRSLQSSRAFAQFTCNDYENSALFDESVTSLKSFPAKLDDAQVNKGNTATADTLSTISPQLISDGNAIDVDSLLRCNDRLEDEAHRLRTLLAKRTTALENEKKELASELSRIRDYHREELQRIKDVMADLMTRAEHLQRSIKDQREICGALTTENNQLRLENHHLRMRQTDLEVEIENGGDGGGGNTGGSSNTGNWLSLWGRGWKVEQAALSTTFPESPSGELHGVTNRPKEYSGGYDSDASEDSSSTANRDFLFSEGNDDATSAEKSNVRINKDVVDNAIRQRPPTEVPPPPIRDDVEEDYDDDAQSEEAEAEGYNRPDLGVLVGGLHVGQSTRSLFATEEDENHDRDKKKDGSLAS